MLNMPGRSRVIQNYRSQSPGTGPVWVQNLDCVGTETSFLQCAHQAFGQSTCSHTNDVIIQCSMDTLLAVNVRLVGGDTPYSGRVEIQATGGDWGTICARTSTRSTASVICRSAGFSGDEATYTLRSSFGQAPSTTQNVLDNLDCVGTESTITECRHGNWGETICTRFDHSQDLGVVCYPPGHLQSNVAARLVDGPDAYTGRLEIRYNNTWGTVCDDFFTDASAAVVCRMLNVTRTAGIQWFSGIIFGNGTDGQIWLDDVNCEGSESNIALCPHSGWGRHNCQHSEDISIICPGSTTPVAPGIRLVGGSFPSEGRVEISLYGLWGTVCDDHWTTREAQVVCRWMGLPSRMALPRIQAQYGMGTGLIMFDDVNCVGTEDTLLQCRHGGFNNHNCRHGEDAGVACLDNFPMEMRLVGGPSTAIGRLELMINGSWGTVCDRGFDQREATVACRQLGYLGTKSYFIRGQQAVRQFGAGTGPIVMDNLNCQGDEYSLIQCTNKMLYNTYCGHSRDVGLHCDDGSMHVRLVAKSSRQPHIGRVEIAIGNSSWSTICDDNFGANSARAICHMLGLPVLNALRMDPNFFPGSDSQSIPIMNLNCRGNETSIAQCSYVSVPRVGFCVHAEDVSVACLESPDISNMIPLFTGSGRTRYSGIMSVSYDGLAGSVCKRGFDNLAAMVFCRWLNLRNIVQARVIQTSYNNPQNNGVVWFSGVNCIGNETSLVDCQRDAIGDTTCYSSERYAAVTCKTAAMLNQTIRLSQAVGNNVGQIEVYYQGWRSICAQNWGAAEAATACRQLGIIATYSIARMYGHTTSYYPSFTEYSCDATSPGLGYCDFKNIGGRTCGNNGYAGVICMTAEPTSSNVRLSGGLTYFQGRAELQVNGIWGTICGQGFSDTDATVFCRQANFTAGGRVLRKSFTANGPAWFSNPGCTGTERQITDCPHRTWGQADCGTSIAAVYCNIPAVQNLQVRLRGSGDPKQGRVEVLFQNQWGTVCDDQFNDTDAAVICRMLGYSSDDAHAFGSAHFGPGTGPIWLDNVVCIGTETNIGQCRNDGINFHNCQHTEDASVSCHEAGYVVTDVQIRLIGGSDSREGTVMIRYHDVWGTICDDYWSDADARVICNMLGLPSETARARSRAAFGPGNGTIWLDNVNCMGNETNIVLCPHAGWGINNCQHYEDAGVVCGSSGPVSAVRLSGSVTDWAGRVEIYHNGSWGTVCDDGFTNENARVVCRQAGLTSDNAVYASEAHYGSASSDVQIWMDDVSCEGSEAGLDRCAFLGWGQHNCIHDEDVSVICRPATSGTQVRLVGGQNLHEGRVEIHKDGVWGTICDDYWDNNDAKVICGMLGYPREGAYANTRAYFGQGSGAIHMDDVRCTGQEGDILSCPASSRRHNCRHTEDAGVVCTEFAPVQARLVGGSHPYEGRVELFIKGQWGTICDDTFNNKTARVICRMLGVRLYRSAQAFGRARFGPGTGPIYLEDVECTGLESNIMACSQHSLYATDNCIHSEDASVICQTPPPTTIAPTTTPVPTVDPSAPFFLRLVGGSTSYEGRVEVYYQGVYGTVCDDFYGTQEAQVICSMLGYTRNGSVAILRTPSTTSFGQASGKIWVDDLQCAGSESSLSLCPTRRGWGVHNCGHNEDGGVRCSETIPDNFMLALDSNTGAINRIDLTTYSYVPIPHNPEDSPTAFGYDPMESKLYYIDTIIKTSSLRGMPTKVYNALAAGLLPGSFAVDPNSRNIYLILKSTKEIQIMNIARRSPATVVSLLQDPQGIAVHSKAGFIFWTDGGFTGSGTIGKARLDGSSKSVIISANLVRPGQITIDYADDKLYWVSASVIQRSGLNGENVETVVSFQGNSNPLGVSIINNAVFYTETGSSTLMRVNKDGSGKTVASSPLGRPSFLLAHRIGYGPADSSVANDCRTGRAGCSDICVSIAGVGNKCLCPKGMALASDGKMCLLSATCPKLTPPLQGQLTPATCSSGDSVSGAACTATCSKGYTIQGVNLMTCLQNGAWTSSLFSCMDTTVPVLTCPDDITKIADQGEWTAVITWQLGDVFDNSEQAPTVTQNPPPGTVFGEGARTVVITATDASNNVNSCSFTVTVTVLRCGQPTLPSNVQRMWSTCPDFYGAACDVTCNEGYSLSGVATSIRCEKDASNKPSWNMNGVACSEGYTGSSDGDSSTAVTVLAVFLALIITVILAMAGFMIYRRRTSSGMGRAGTYELSGAGIDNPSYGKADM